MLPEDRTNAKKTKLSKRMKSLLESPKHRVLAFKNGVSHGGAEVLTNRFDEVRIFVYNHFNYHSSSLSKRLLFRRLGVDLSGGETCVGHFN